MSTEKYNSKWIAFASVQLSKVGPAPLQLTNTMTLHWRRNVSENEMRGIAVVEAMKAKPGFSIDNILIGIAYQENE